MFLLVGFTSFGQDQTINGTVTSEEGLPLPGVNVFIKGSTTGTQTDFDGLYTINANQDDILVFSFVGKETQEVIVSNQSTIDVTLADESAALEEVVITAQGIRAKPRSLSYALETVEADDVQKSRETNLVSALSSKASGVQVTTSSGSVGASANIRVRGNTSITRSNSPLFVVDGVPIDNSSFSEDPTQTNNNSSLGGSDFSNRAIDINSNDIASVSILKGIAAQTLYGLRASNGVVLITTKKRSGR
ncbi:carboxypeptidase-like regulatory domain-containing protein [Gillisia marina]|uniref:carboxypeptidase-like regulatory domain-containing protein n=1 Tax=Gillisia marina TaxID=1167637 RepID=UPI001ED930FD|nr:carboxypeptidase-like regulatory domain-containing protein [Gillisia marina]